jgi:NADH-quinone oxidoreductase subunit J
MTMTAVAYISGAVALLASLLAVTRRNTVHGALYLVLSLLAIALVFFALGAPFVAALEVIVYAGAIMVLFVFVVMMLNLGRASEAQESVWLSRRTWTGPALLALILAAELAWVLARGAPAVAARPAIEVKAVGAALFGTYALAVEVASFLLLAALVGVFHIGYRATADEADDPGPPENPGAVEG